MRQSGAVDLLYSPKALARAVTPWIALLLAIVGGGSIAFEGLVARPEIVRLAREGRRVSGTVLSVSDVVQTGKRAGGDRNRSLVAVNDEILGVQVVSVYGVLQKDSPVPMICATPARRCLSAAEVNERMDLWPLTPLMLGGATELGLAALIAVAARRRLRPRDAAFAVSSSSRDVA